MKFFACPILTNANNLFLTSLEFTVCIGAALAFGIASVANEFEPLFFGKGYDACVLLTIVLSPVLIIKAFSITARYQYLVPFKKEKDYTISVLAGAIVNVILNSILIPQYGAMGAVIGTLAAELSACVWQYIVLSKYIHIGKTLYRCIVYTGTNIIGTRHGEKLYETLMTREECLRSEDMGDYFRVAADTRDLNYDQFFVDGEVKTMAEESYTSDNTRRLDVEGTIKKILTTEYKYGSKWFYTYWNEGGWTYFE